jgi:DNA-binding transcriptional ArsR family regulator
LIDRIRHDIQQRLDQLLAEADRLRRALAALDPRRNSAPASKSTRSQASATRAATSPAASKKTPARTSKRGAGAVNGARASQRTAPGQTKATVLAALAGDRVLTAGEVATATGLARPTVSTTLSRLAKAGEVVKADRGYQLPRAGDVTPSAAGPASTSTNKPA